ncbi:MAG: TonB-dependent receptor domain-containing protein [Candidatus Malihini olakiniferum]
MTCSFTKDKVSPYAGLIYDINDTLSAYVSYTSIFQSQDNRDVNGNYLVRIEGKNYETDLKSDWFDGSLTVSMTVFRIRQDNLMQTDISNKVNGSNDQAYLIEVVYALPVTNVTRTDAGRWGKLAERHLC